MGLRGLANLLASQKAGLKKDRTKETLAGSLFPPKQRSQSAGSKHREGCRALHTRKKQCAVLTCLFRAEGENQGQQAVENHAGYERLRQKRVRLKAYRSTKHVECITSSNAHA